jgi:predicted aconitase
MHTTSANRTAIAVLRIEIRGGNDERDMREIGTKLGYDVDEQLVAIDPHSEAPLKTVMKALRATGATAVIVPDIDHIDGIDHQIHERALIVTVEGERVLERAATGAAA